MLQVFHFKVVLANREHHMFPDDVVIRIFSNIKSIYQFHHDFLLPQLERRMTEQWVWCQNIHATILISVCRFTYVSYAGSGSIQDMVCCLLYFEPVVPWKVWRRFTDTFDTVPTVLVYRSENHKDSHEWIHSENTEQRMVMLTRPPAIYYKAKSSKDSAKAADGSTSIHCFTQ